MRLSQPKSGWRGRNLKRVLAYLGPHRVTIPLLLCLALLASALGAFEPLLHGTIVRTISSLGQEAAPARALLRPILLLAGILVVRPVLEGITTLISWRVRLKINLALLSDATKKLHTLPIAYHHDHGVGETMTRLDRGIATLMEGLSSIAFQIVPSLAYLILSTVIMMRLNPILAMVALSFVIPPVLVGRRGAGRLSDQERELMDRWCHIYNRFHQVLAGIKTVKAFAREGHEHERFVSSVKDAQGQVMSNVRVQTRLQTMQTTWVNLGRVMVLGIGGVLVARGQLELGALVSFLGYAGGLYGPMQTLLGLYVTVRRAEFGLSVFSNVLDAEDSVPDSPRPLPVQRLTGKIEFDDVSMRYGAENGGTWALSGVSLTIAEGEFLALVGPSGAGKTTLVDLILRLHDPSSGVVKIDGRDLRTLSQRDLRRQLGIVAQEPFLFDDTIAANIRYGSPDASDAEVERAAHAAFAHDFVARLKDGYATRIGRGGSQLSGGERQRIAIARTFLKDPSVVLLDEPTSSLDVESEHAVHRALEKLTRGRTTIVVAHRLSLTSRADRVVVLAGGKIVEHGPPQVLLRAGGPYQRMFRLWSEDHGASQLPATVLAV